MASVPRRPALPRISWVTAAIVLLTVGVLTTFGLELRYIVRSRPPPEVPASILWIEGGRGSEPGYFDAPIGLAVHPSGDIYVADMGNARVQRLSADGVFLSLWPRTPAGEWQLVRPSDVAVGGTGEVFALDAAGAIYRLDPDGNLTEVVSLVQLQAFAPHGLAVDDARGLFYVADTGRGRVLLAGRDGSFVDAWGDGDDGGLTFEQPHGLGLDRHGNLFVAETANSRVRKISPDGLVLAQWRVKGRIADLAVGPDDQVYVTAADRARLWIYDSEGKELGQVEALFEEESVPPTSGLAVLGAGEVVMGTESSILRLSVQLKQ